MSSVSIQLSEAPSLLQHIRRNRKSCHCCKQKAGFTPIHQLMGWLRCHLSFLLLRSPVLCLRGSRSNPNHVSDPPLDLVVHEGWIPWCINCLTSYNIQSFKYLTPHYCHFNYGLFYDIIYIYIMFLWWCYLCNGKHQALFKQICRLLAKLPTLGLWEGWSVAGRYMGLFSDITHCLKLHTISNPVPIVPIHKEESFLSPIFLVLKADGSWQPVIHLKSLNKHIVAWHLKVESIRTVKGHWMAKLSLIKSYVPLGPHLSTRFLTPEIPPVPGAGPTVAV